MVLVAVKLYEQLLEEVEQIKKYIKLKMTLLHQVIIIVGREPDNPF